MPQDKDLEERVLQGRFEYLSSNLPPDDVAIEMNSKGLLTAKEHEEYLSMKRAHTSDSTKSEYLLQCLGRRKAGFLTTFCEILRGIEQASYLADDIHEAYKAAALQLHGLNPRLGSRDRHSKISLSDPDLHIKDIYVAQECTRCKVLELENKRLEKQCRQLKEQQELHQTTFLPLKPLAEVAQDQLQRALTEGNKLKELLPSVQEAVTQTNCHISAVQISLWKMNDMLAQEMTNVKELETYHSAQLSRCAAKGDTNISEVYQHQDHNAYGTSSSETATTGLGLTQHIKGQERTHMSNSLLHEISRASQRRKSESAVQIKKQRLLQLRTVRSTEESNSAKVGIDIDDPQFRSILKQRREHVEAASNNTNT